MDIIVARRADCFLYTWDGYIYLSNKKTQQKVYVRCHKSECPAGGHFPRDSARGYGITLRDGGHCHPPEYEYIEEMQFRQELRRVAQREPDLPMQLIYEEVAARYPHVSERVSYGCSRGLIQRHKSKERQQHLLTAIDDFNHRDDDQFTKKREEVERPRRSHSVKKDDVHLMLVGDIIDQDDKNPDATERPLYETGLSSYRELVEEKRELEKRLGELLKQLDAAHVRLTSVALNSDTFDCFGKYVASLLRGLSASTVIKLKQQMIESILTARLAEAQVTETPEPLDRLITISSKTPEYSKKKTMSSSVDPTFSESVLEDMLTAECNAEVMEHDDKTNRSDTCSYIADDNPDSNFQPVAFRRKRIRNRRRYGKTIRRTGAETAYVAYDSYIDVEEAVAKLHYDVKTEEGKEPSSPTPVKVRRLQSQSKTQPQSQVPQELRTSVKNNVVKGGVVCHICSRLCKTDELLMRHVISHH